MKTAPFARFTDKVMFIIGALGLQFSMYLLGRFPHDYMFYWALCLTIVLLTIKFIYYKRNGWHYYFTDFCYTGNTSLYLFLFLFSETKFMYLSAFTYSTGIMAFGIMAFRNSLVFHDVDRLSSMLIHVVPLKIMWSVHWFTARNDEGFTFWNPEENTVTLFQHFFWPAVIFFSHQVFYVSMNFIIFNKTIYEKDYANSFRYMTEGGPLTKLVKSKPLWQ